MLDTVDEPITEPKPSSFYKFKKWGTLIGGIIYMLYIGGLYIDGNIAPYIAIYFGVTKEKTSNLLLNSLIWQALF